MITPISNQFTKEAIKSRMMHHAASLWGVKNPHSLDPLVRLLMEAFSLEIYRAANETQQVEGRILDKIARLLTPTLLTMPQAAHAILQVRPLEPYHLLHTHTHFYTEQRIWSRSTGMADSHMDIPFTPVDGVPLVKGGISYVAAGSRLHAFDEAANKMPLPGTGTPLPWGTMLVGLTLDAAVENLKDISLYFDFPAYQSQPWVYELLPLCQATLGQQSIAVSSGRSYINEGPEPAAEDLFDDRDLMRRVTTDVKTLYQHQFLTLGNCPVAAPETRDDASYPEELLRSYGAASLQAGGVSGKLTWLRLQFPSNYTYDMLENCQVAINAFPVLNRQLLRNTYSYKILNNIVPLRTAVQERFIAVHRVSDSHDRLLSEIPYNRNVSGRKGYYSLRQGGTERFDERSAQDMVNYLIELTRDEVAAFSSLNQDFIFNTLQELSRQLKLLQNKTEKTEVHIGQAPTYLIAEPWDEADALQVDYWVCHAELANGIRPGTPFGVRSCPDIVPATINLLTYSVGGRDKLQPGDRLDAYRYVLSSRSRLITREDIRNFCKYELGSRLKEVQFENGLALSSHPRQGYVRTLDIKLIPQRHAALDTAEWSYLAQRLHAKIKAISQDGINYRVLVDQ